MKMDSLSVDEVREAVTALRGKFPTLSRADEVMMGNLWAR